MLLSDLIPVILSGGTGSRLWPLSRENYPKQFLSLTSDKTLFQDTVLRTASLGLGEPIIVCNDDHRFIVAENLRAINRKARNIILEPSARNTAPAICAAAMFARQSGSDPTLLILPSDHVIDDVKEFERQLQTAQILADQGEIVTFGIQPTHAHTGYGYIEIGGNLQSDAYKIHAFTEKPNSKTAEEFFKGGLHLWNSGMFCFQASVFLKELQKHRPDIYKHVHKAVERSTRDLDFDRLDADAFGQCPKIPMDYAVMEHSDKGVVVPLNAGWNDIGSWDALYHASSTQNKPAVIRPWGYYKIIAEEDGYKTKAIHVNVGGKLSLQTHEYRAEHWVVVGGMARITKGDEIFTLRVNESVFIPIGCVHALENAGDQPLEIIEVQTGDYLGEDDIIRYEDRYGRV